MIDITPEEQAFIEEKIENGKELILAGDVENVLDAIFLWMGFYQGEPNSTSKADYAKMSKLYDDIEQRNRTYDLPQERNNFRETGRIMLTPEERSFIETEVENGQQLLQDNDLDEIMDELDWKAFLAMKGAPPGMDSPERRRICSIILSVGERNRFWERPEKNLPGKSGARKPPERVIFELTTKERRFIRRNLENGSKLIIDGDLDALYIAMLRWVMGHEMDQKGSLTRAGQETMERAEEIWERHCGENQPGKSAKRLEVKEEERAFILENLLFGESMIREGNLRGLSLSLTSWVNKHAADEKKEPTEKGRDILAMRDEILLRNTRKENRLELTEDEYRFVQKTVEEGTMWICHRQLEKLNRRLMHWIAWNGTDENKRLTPEGERIHQMRKAIFRRNNKRTDLA